MHTYIHIHICTKLTPRAKLDATVKEKDIKENDFKREQLVKETKEKESKRAENLLQEKKKQLADAKAGLDIHWGKGEIPNSVLFPSPII